MKSGSNHFERMMTTTLPHRLLWRYLTMIRQNSYHHCLFKKNVAHCSTKMTLKSSPLSSLRHSYFCTEYNMLNRHLIMTDRFSIKFQQDWAHDLSRCRFPQSGGSLEQISNSCLTLVTWFNHEGFSFIKFQSTRVSLVQTLVICTATCSWQVCPCAQQDPGKLSRMQLQDLF